MKEFDKKSSPNREGFSKFLPASMSDSSTRRRLTEYEIQVQDLQAYVRSLEAETVHLRKKLEETVTQEIDPKTGKPVVKKDAKAKGKK